MKPWGLWATLGFAVLAFGLGQALGVAALAAVKTFDPQHVDFDGTAIAIVTLVANPVQIVTLVLAARLGGTGTGTLEYFGLNVPRWRDVTIAIAALAVMIVVADGVTLVAGRELVPPFQLEIHRSAQADGTLAWLMLAVIVVAPIGEELLFRGFMFRGLVHEPRDALPGIVIIALIWSLLHVQYDWFGAAVVFVVGVLFGYVRYLTGSTTLVIGLHILLNLESVLETLVALGWL
jgi:membrane protease YdiL (CAAX protease family)